MGKLWGLTRDDAKKSFPMRHYPLIVTMIPIATSVTVFIATQDKEYGWTDFNYSPVYTRGAIFFCDMTQKSVNNL